MWYCRLCEKWTIFNKGCGGPTMHQLILFPKPRYFCFMPTLPIKEAYDTIDTHRR